MLCHWSQLNIGGDFTEKIGKTLFAFVKSSDIPNLIDQGYADIGFVGSDKIDEQRLGGKWSSLLDQSIAYADCDLVAIASNKKKKLGQRIVTSFPNLTNRWIDSKDFEKGMRPEVVFTPTGSTEAYIALGVGDSLVDIRETGETIVSNCLVELEIIEPIYTKMLWKNNK